MEKKIKNLLITGSEGLIGKLLSSKITGYNIAKLDQIFANYSRYVRSNLQSVAELNEKLAEFLPIDCILHLAAECNSRAAWETVLINNIIATRTLFEFARENNVTKVIFASSNHVTGLYEGNPPSLHLGIEDTKIISPKMPICPDGYYGVSKAFGEAIGRYFSETFNIKTICLRIGSVLN
jgi:nucleoside-diphosphate-sugar epimerase